MLQKVDDLEPHNLNIERNSKTNLKFIKDDVFEKVYMIVKKPTPPNELFPSFSGIIPCQELELYSKKDQIWAMCQVVEEDIAGPIPTWAAYNSLITSTPTITTCQGLPLYPSSPTDWSTLYTALKIVQEINVEVTGENKTIVSLDLQLYSKCMQLRERKEIRDQFIFRLGELHIVFAMLKVIGKYIDQSGIDRLFIETGIYGENTLKQIINGKHMKRGVEAHVTMYLALFRILFMEQFEEKGEHSQYIDEFKKELSNFSRVPFENIEEIAILDERILILSKFQVYCNS